MAETRRYLVTTYNDETDEEFLGKLGDMTDSGYEIEDQRVEHAYTLAEIRNGTGFDRAARFVQV